MIELSNKDLLITITKKVMNRDGVNELESIIIAEILLKEEKNFTKRDEEFLKVYEGMEKALNNTSLREQAQMLKRIANI